jgi:hypothetical protein
MKAVLTLLLLQVQEQLPAQVHRAGKFLHQKVQMEQLALQELQDQLVQQAHKVALVRLVQPELLALLVHKVYQ